MAHLLANLGGNPLNTPVGQKIEQATDASLTSENWALNIEICDLINETDEGPKDAIKAIRKRLQQNIGKNYTVVVHTLTVLETCVKNCGKRFQLLACNKDFVLELVKLIGPKNDPPAAVQERVLGLIQSWADAFQGNPDMQGVCQAYQDLKLKGIEFPMTDLDAMAPIHTPQRTVPAPKQSAPPLPEHPSQGLQPTEAVTPQRVSPNPVTVTDASSAVSLTQEQLVKLRSELNIVEGNMKVFGEMLTELTPGKEHSQDLELLQELHKTCVAMQSRIVELINKVGIEEVTSELLRINDELNNMFLRYERYEKKRTLTKSQPEPVRPVQQPVEDLSDKPLIDFGDSSESSEADIAAQVSDLSISKPYKTVEVSNSASAASNSTSINAIADEFDIFAHSRNVAVDSGKTRGSSYADNMNIDQTTVGLASYAQKKGQLNSAALEGDSHVSISNSEFEKFLAERAGTDKSSTVVPESARVTPQSVPSVPAAAAVLPPQSIASGLSNKRQIEKDDSESALFAL